MPRSASPGVVLVRGLLRRCPRCGQRKLFRRWFTMAPRCPRCALNFDRGEGFWLGSLAINLGVTEATFAVVLVGGIVLTWPDVPWAWLAVASVLTNVIVPVLFLPFSKTIFLAVDLLLHRVDLVEPPDSGTSAA